MSQAACYIITCPIAVQEIQCHVRYQTLLYFHLEEDAFAFLLQSLWEDAELFEEEDEIFALEVVEFVVGDLLEERLQELLVFLQSSSTIKSFPKFLGNSAVLTWIMDTIFDLLK